ncbi:hypothetical protein NKR23_g6584 [Pleurostoma richardsiae]|uniref:N-acetyltransferase domain-containing protein n=1 Tax=Pleurostoma richardsiae TaxID=41990 RepID=A0AA38VP40_9PEZI|nr:hypothetical protein NKR23_g6584 [Pleurostoma richardsiae]
MAIVNKATPADVKALVDIFYSGFNDEFFEPLFPQSRECREFLEEAYGSWIKGKEGRQEAMVYVVRDEDGKTLSVASYWVIKPGDNGLQGWRSRWPAVPPGMSTEGLEEFFAGMESQHELGMGTKEHIYLEILATQESARRRGYGSMLLDIGKELADGMDYPLYLDAERDSKSLYIKAGYQELTDIAQSSPLSPLMRLRKSEREAEEEI